MVQGISELILAVVKKIALDYYSCFARVNLLEDFTACASGRVG